jgi:exopolysaccharide biosynthesis protein
MGLSIPELAELMAELGCKAAYNLDGGISAQMTWRDALVNSPKSSRSIRDIVYIAESEDVSEQSD